MDSLRDHGEASIFAVPPDGLRDVVQDDWIEHLRVALVPRYELGELVGEGGMALVFRTRDKSRNVDVALKILRPALAHDDHAVRFSRETYVQSLLDHPAVLPVLDSDTILGLPYYTMPLMDGSLADRLRGGRRLPVRDALEVVDQIADGLEHAHERGFVHRDVKPSNILFAERNHLISDFGVVRASERDWTRRTVTGDVVGTIEYMSPEQISPGSADHRADQYALATVLFEMLAGEVPFVSRNQQNLAARKLSQPPPSLRSLRDSVPEVVSDTVARALQREPEDRFGSVREFAQALRSGWEEHRRTRRWRAAVAAVVVVAFLVVVQEGDRLTGLLGGVEPDTTRYAVLPFVAQGTDAEPFETELNAALAEWSGIAVVGRPDVLREFPRAEPQALSRVRRAARRMDAGRFITGRADRQADSIRVAVSVIDGASGGSSLRRVTFSVPAGPTVPTGLLQRVAEELVFGSALAGPGVTPSGTGSAPARRYYGAAWTAVRAWELIEAERLLNQAIGADRGFDLARLWRAQVKSWRGDPMPEWEADAARAARAVSLPEREGLLAAALAAMVEDRHPDACLAYQGLLNEDRTDFAALFGLGECHASDQMVLPDPSSPTDWSFRGSAGAAAGFYREALTLLPAGSSAFGAGGFELARVMPPARPTVRRGASAAPERRLFLGFDEWVDDSLVTVAVPMDELQSYSPDPAAMVEAVRRQRSDFLRVATAWVDAFPQSSEALHALAVAQELVGAEEAVRTYSAARELAASPEASARIGIKEVMLRVRAALPGDLEGLEAAIAIADELLEEFEAGRLRRAPRLHELAVLRGRPSLAAAIVRAGPVDAAAGDVPPEVTRESNALIAFASVGGPRDSVRALTRRTEARIADIMGPEEVTGTRRSLLEQPSYLAFPFDTAAYLFEADPQGPEARAIGALLRGDTATALAALATSSPVDAGWDVLVTHANVLLAVGDARGALRTLSTSLDGLASTDPMRSSGMSRVGSLVRAAALRAVLEASVGSEEEGARWAGAVELLWSDGEGTEVLSRMRAALGPS